MVRKVYQSLYYQLFNTYVMVDGVKVSVNFTGGSLVPKINGTFVTTDEKIQEAIEKSGGFNKDYKLTSTETIVEEEPEEEKEQIPDDYNKVSGIKTAQKARDFLLEQKIEGLTASQLPNIAAIKEVAAANKIVFLDLK